MYLLDKNIVRKAAVGVALLRLGRTVPAVERRCLALLLEGRRQSVRLFIGRETYNILVRHETQIEAQIVLSLVEVLERGRYFKRWARRLRGYGFTSEDASFLSLGTFGTDVRGTLLGVSAVVTTDKRFIRNFEAQRSALQRRLKAMTVQLPPPYRYAALPVALEPELALRAMGRAASDQSD